MRRLILSTIFVCFANAIAILLLAWILPGFSISNGRAFAATVVTLAIVPALAWPVIYRVSSATHPLLFPVLTFAISGAVVFFTAKLLDDIGFKGVRIDSIWTGIVIAFALPVVSNLIGGLFALNDEEGYNWFVERPFQRRYASTKRSTQPGILFLEIDGLAEPILREAMAAGYAPTLKRWLDEGSHTLTPWETDLSSQTGASQAGLLMGNNDGIPAFRWWDKERGRLMVTSSASDVRLLETDLVTGNGLLTDGGASRWNVFSGEADDSIATFSTIGTKRVSNQSFYLIAFSNIYLIARVFGLFVGDIVRERWQAFRQRRHDIQPRIVRKFKYSFVRSATTTVMQEASRFMLLADMYRGVPAVYNTFFAYDEVAHHSGIRSPDALKVLKQLDRVIGSLEEASKRTPRTYELVVLSDHGQSNGATFRQRYGETLDDLVRRLIAPGADIFAQLESRENLSKVQATLDEAVSGEQRTARLIRSAIKRQQVKHADPDHAATEEGARNPETSDVVVLASGNLGLISFPKLPGHLSFETIVDQHPNLMIGLRAHPGVSFFVVRSEDEGWLAASANGVYYLDHDTVEGENPLLPFGPNAALHLKREVSFANVPDILVMSMYDVGTGEVAAFEELVGSHGGLGGTQAQPFVLHPTHFDAGAEPIIGPVMMHAVMKRWRAESEAEGGE